MLGSNFEDNIISLNFITSVVKYLSLYYENIKLLISKSSIFYFVVVENVYKNREPVPHMKAIYFITPTKKVRIFFKEKKFCKIFQPEKAIFFSSIDILIMTMQCFFYICVTLLCVLLNLP